MENFRNEDGMRLENYLAFVLHTEDVNRTFFDQIANKYDKAPTEEDYKRMESFEYPLDLEIETAPYLVGEGLEKIFAMLTTYGDRINDVNLVDNEKFQEKSEEHGLWGNSAYEELYIFIWKKTKQVSNLLEIDPWELGHKTYSELVDQIITASYIEYYIALKNNKYWG